MAVVSGHKKMIAIHDDAARAAAQARRTESTEKPVSQPHEETSTTPTSLETEHQSVPPHARRRSGYYSSEGTSFTPRE